MALSFLDDRFLASEMTASSNEEARKTYNELLVFKKRAQAAWSESQALSHELQGRNQRRAANKTPGTETQHDHGNDHREEALLQSRENTFEIGEILERITALTKLALDLINFLGGHKKDDMILEFRDEKAKWERSGDRKRLSMLEMDVGSMTRDVPAMNQQHPLSGSSQRAFEPPSRYSTSSTSLASIASTPNADLERDTALLNDLSNRTQRMCAQVADLKRVARSMEPPVHDLHNAIHTGHVRAHMWSADQSIRDFDRILANTAFVKHRLEELQYWRGIAESQPHSLRGRRYKREITQWDKDVDAIEVKQYETELGRCCEAIEMIPRMRAAGHAGQTPPVPGQLPRYETIDPLKKNSPDKARR